MPNNIDFVWESFLEFSKQANVSPNFIYSEIEHLYVEPIELAKSFGSFSYLEGKLSDFKIINDPKIKIKYPAINEEKIVFFEYCIRNGCSIYFQLKKDKEKIVIVLKRISSIEIEFIKIYFGNNAMNTTELCKILPIYDIWNNLLWNCSLNRI